MNQIMLHCGGVAATIEDLKTVTLPEQTATYHPVSHYDLVDNVGRVASELLHDHTLDKTQYALAKGGQRMFAVHAYRNGQDMKMSIAFRNSYDKSMAVGLAVGASVMVCDNLMLSGKVTVLRKHTANIIEDIGPAILTATYNARASFRKLSEDAERMRELHMSHNEGFKLLGLLFGVSVLKPHQLTVAAREWKKPSHQEFEPQTLWSLYNAVTAALKSTPPQRVMESHIKLHDVVVKEYLDGR